MPLLTVGDRDEKIGGRIEVEEKREKVVDIERKVRLEIPLKA